MNIKLLISAGALYPSQIGGPCNTLYWIGKELVKNGTDVTTVVSDIGLGDNIIRDEWILLNGIRIKYCKVKNPKSSFRLTYLTMKEVRKKDVIMLNSLFYKTNFFVGLTALILNKKIIWSPRGELLFRRGAIKKVFLKAIKFIFAKRVTFHATSTEEVDAIQETFGRNTKVILIPNYMELPEKAAPKSEEKYFLYVGRIMPIKALDLLIEGVALSGKFMEKGYKLYLAGKNSGKYYEKLLTLIDQKSLKDRVLFKGMVEGEDKESLYAGAKATMLVSHSENFGNVIIESMAQGTPAITSKGTPWQELEKNGIGFWINNSPKNIADSIDEILSFSDEKYEKMREDTYEYCKKEFDISHKIDQWIDAIKN